MSPATRDGARAADVTGNGSLANGRSVLRRAPFSANPTVGPRGQRTQQRILDAALRVLRDEGYHRCSVERIARLAGCSRVSFYQYFSGKEDVYYDLAGQVTRQARAAVEGLELLDAGDAGWKALRAWVARSSDIFERYGPVFNEFEVAAERTAAVGELRAIAESDVASIRSKLATVSLPTREIDAVLTLLLGGAVRTFHLAGVLRAAAPASYARERIEDALADVFHRALFGVQFDVNVRAAPPKQPPVLAFDPATRELLIRGPAVRNGSESGKPTVETLLAAGRQVFVERGYHGTRVDDIVNAAGLSHGAFYRYFKNKDDFAHVVVLDAIRPLSGAFASVPEPDSDGVSRAAALRRWLRHYNASHVHEAAIIRIWVDAAAPGRELGGDAAPAVDWGRRRMARFLRPRQFGDVEADALVMVALLDAFGGHTRQGVTVDALAHIIERGLLGQ
jgi:AcrR family transcriptional regulator